MYQPEGDLFLQGQKVELENVDANQAKRGGNVGERACCVTLCLVCLLNSECGGAVRCDVM